jgi:hypothetical protein
MTPRHFGSGFGFERFGVEREGEQVTIENRSGDRWAVAALVGFVLVLGGIGLYALSNGYGPTIAMAPVDETSGQSTRPTLPTLPQ